MAKVRVLIDDTDASRYIISSERLGELLYSRMLSLANEVGVGPSWALAAVTTAAATTPTDYTLPSTVQYEALHEVRLRDAYEPLLRVSRDELDQLRAGTPLQTGRPTCFAAWEGPSQVVSVGFFPEPNAAFVVDVLRSAVPSEFATDASVIPFSDPLLRALEKLVALDCIALMPEEARADRRVNAEVMSAWFEEVGRAMYWEKVRLARLQRAARRSMWGA